MKITQSAKLLDAVVATGPSASMQLKQGEDTLNVFLVTSGTVSLTVDVESLCAATNTWHKVGSSGSVTTVGNQAAIVVTNLAANEVRLNVSARTNGTVTGVVVAGRMGV